MRTVIGEYESLALATSAVRALQSEISIQNIVIADQTDRAWRKRDPAREREPGRTRASRNFLVSMSGNAEDVGHARALLCAHAAR